MKFSTVSLHKQWLDNEYSGWVTALQECTVDNFRDHPMVKRMLGHPNDWAVLRMIKYGRMVLDRKPGSIVEIGGGAGQFYAILRVMGYTGKYYIMDLDQVVLFQRDYLKKASEITGLNMDLVFCLPAEFCVSLFSLGEFDDDIKKQYIETVVKKCPHGLIVWNPHSGASFEINFPCTIEDEYPLTSPGNKILTW